MINAKVISQELIAQQIYRLCVSSPELVSKMHTPGQFVNIRIGKGNEFVLRRPISICQIEPEKDQFVMIYRAQGAGTKALAQLGAGDELDILGPLGQGYDLDTLAPGQTALLVGGGIGVPPLYELARRFQAKGVKTIHVLGFNQAQDVFYAQEFEALGTTIVCTADGSYGFKGFVTQAIAQLELDYDAYYACGPTPMLKALSQELNKPGYVSLEERMACGVGACYACVCQDKQGEVKRICFDGPVFKAKDITFA
ncbi:dihydroorotate dehydrogenase electron transfer subunit [Psittacicella melopsittaci]|uniref:Dihydroorotate dehydrogenase B (NAD(+)), electron transfer subunit n=1 Tax=Psittacicella melopsittaci TaxID=2028576 RepID=A0A3A1Y436_9GAMM|nr:dihydroorotate dehydrogenase electron transfer subunit [Psittacicella melopsittaci]RIY32211.1 dihydroorotate dehydrogenase electron transfer subunit [Psittacicella melopsittaci]